MQNNSTPAPDEKSSSSAPTNAPFILNCLLYDTSAKHPIRCADVVLTSGGIQVLATTDPDGMIRLLEETEANSHWQDLEMPHEGDWLVQPNTEKYDTHYFFEPVHFPAFDSEEIVTVEVQGNYYKNVQQLETYVENVFLSGRDTFRAEMKRYDPKKVTEEQIIEATKIAYSIVERGLDFIVSGRPLQPQPAQYELTPETVEHLCNVLRGEADDSRRDKILCSLCYTRYSTNQARLNTCLCCEPCIPG